MIFCRRLADLVGTERLWVATMVIFVWIKLMDPLQAVFQDFFLLVKMIALMIGEEDGRDFQQLVSLKKFWLHLRCHAWTSFALELRLVRQILSIGRTNEDQDVSLFHRRLVFVGQRGLILFINQSRTSCPPFEG